MKQVMRGEYPRNINDVRALIRGLFVDALDVRNLNAAQVRHENEWDEFSAEEVDEAFQDVLNEDPLEWEEVNPSW